MRRIRVIPILLINEGKLVKSIKFKNYKYVGDPINAVRIFNEKEVDEIIVLDISASKKAKSPNLEFITNLAEEAFMPFSYGGGISSVDHVKSILELGAEKVVLNTSSIKKPNLVSDIAKRFGSQSVVVSVDYKKNFFGKEKVFSSNGKKNTKLNPLSFIKKVESFGAGEIMLNSITRDGTYQGYDLDYLKLICDSVKIPVIACGGASSIEDFLNAVSLANASAVSAGSMFVFKRPYNAVLINYPTQNELIKNFYSKL